jgi:glycosyltransferase involved in cell wall biosynthesis
MFVPTPEADGDPVVLLAARMLWDKGIGEFIEAAKATKRRGIRARFVLVGIPDTSNPSSIPENQLRAWQDAGLAEWWGHREEMPSVLAQAHIVVLPSYREGLPKVLLEAAACGRPVVTTDVPGCREVVRNGLNGFIVPVRDSDALVEALARLIDDPALRRRMGACGRRIVEEAFTAEIVTAQTIQLYRKLLGGVRTRSAIELRCSDDGHGEPLSAGNQIAESHL